MKRVKTAVLVPGMVMAKDVHNASDALVVAKDTVLNDEAITKLTFHSIFSVYVTDDSVDLIGSVVPKAPEAGEPSGEQPAPAVMESAVESQVVNTPEFKRFAEAYEKEIDDVKDTFNQVISLQKKRPPIADLCKQATSMIEDGQSTYAIFDMLHNIRSFDDSTFNHCLNVALICNLFADWMHMSAYEKETATVAGLMHDIGKLKVPEELIKKAGKLTDEEYEIVKSHPVEGYKILFEAKFDMNIQNAALMHHERSDGSGYPMGKKRDEIDKYAKMVAIADVYDAMTAARVYRGAQCPFKVIEMFEREGYTMFDPEYLLVFLENIVQTYMRSTAVLSDGRKGTIVMMNKQKLSKPVLICGNQVVNLMECPDVKIDKIII